MKTNVAGRQVVYGTGSGRHVEGAPALVLIHGAGFDHSVWVMHARYFARHGYNVVAPDLPAHGGSEGPALTTVEEMSAWVLALADALGLSSFSLAGHSLGSLVAMETGLSAPDRVSRLALLGTSAPMPVGAPLLDAAADDHRAAFDMANTWSHSTRGRLGAAQVPGVSNFVSGARWLQRMQPGVYHADLNACNAYQVSMRAFAMPTLVIAGDEDKMTNLRAGQAVAAQGQAARTVVLQGCGHAMLSEQPNQVLDALADFIIHETSRQP